MYCTTPSGTRYQTGRSAATRSRQSLEEMAKKKNPLGRFGTHQELADLAAFLVSDQSGYVNGEQIVMDGGEQLKGASEFAHMGDMLTEEQWQMMKPKKK